MDILLAVKPQYVECMRRGHKRVELRKRVSMRGISSVFVYESSPIKMITGVFYPVKIEHLQVDSLWEKSKSLSCISKSDFDLYFKGRPYGFALWFNFFTTFEPIPVASVPVSTPQSYIVLTEAQVAILGQLIPSVQPSVVS